MPRQPTGSSSAIRGAAESTWMPRPRAVFGTLRTCGQWGGRHSGGGVKASLASTHSRAESPMTCGACDVNGHRAVARLGARSDADLAWETELIQHLDREGLTVPVPIPTTDGRLFADGLVVMTYVEGGPPETEADWRRVADTLRQLHRLTPGVAAAPGLALVDRPPARRDR